MFGSFKNWLNQEKKEAQEDRLKADDVKFSPFLWVYILISLVLGFGIGLYLSNSGLSQDTKNVIAEWLELPGLIFIDLLRMIIIPLIISSIVLGIAVSHDKEFLKKLGIRIVPYFIATTAVAITIGLTAVYTINPGQYVDTSQLQQSVSVQDVELQTFDDLTVPQRIRNLIPVNLTKAEYHGQLLQIVVFSIFLGVITLNLPDKKTKTFTDLMYFAQTACMKVVGWAIALAPYAVFGLLASITTKIGLDTISTMAAYMLTVLVSLACVLILYGLIVFILGHKNPFKFFKNIRALQLLAFSTSSSSAVMPISMSVAEQRLGVKPAISRFVVPLGATINMDGTALYQAVAAIFLTQIYGVDLSTTEIIMLLITTIGASIGTPGTPGVGLIVLATIITSIGVPAEGVALILGVDRLLDMCRTTVNVTGDLTACTVMDRWLPLSKIPAKKEEAAAATSQTGA